MDAAALASDGLERTLAAVGLGAARTIPIAWLLPAFGGPHVTAPVRVGLGLGLAVLCLPLLLGAPVPAHGPAGLVLLVARELMVGVTVGLVASFAFRAAEASGRITDILRGSNMAEVLSPTSDERTSPLGDLSLMLAVVVFLELGGVGHLATALARSYEAIPIGAGASVGAARAASEVVITASVKLLESAVGLAAPVIVAFLLTELALGAIARAAPQIPIYFAAMPGKALLGVGLALLGLGTLSAVLTGGFPGWLALCEAAFRAWR